MITQHKIKEKEEVTMRDCYKYNSIKSWKEYYKEKAKGFPYCGSAAYKLNDGSYNGNNKIHEPSFSFSPYWLALELIHEGKKDALKITIPELLAKCKKNYEFEKERLEQFKSKPDTYNGYPLIWEHYRAYDEDYNGYDCETKICTLPFRATKEDKAALREQLYIRFVRPCCDGRDCTGAPFTGYIKIFTTVDKTIIIHKIHYDV